MGWFFFFKQKTAYEMCGRDWSSDVCSSDLLLSFSRRYSCISMYESVRMRVEMCGSERG